MQYLHKHVSIVILIIQKCRDPQKALQSMLDVLRGHVRQGKYDGLNQVCHGREVQDRDRSRVRDGRHLRVRALTFETTSDAKPFHPKQVRHVDLPSSHSSRKTPSVVPSIFQSLMDLSIALPSTVSPTSPGESLRTGTVSLTASSGLVVSELPLPS